MIATIQRAAAPTAPRPADTRPVAPDAPRDVVTLGSVSGSANGWIGNQSLSASIQHDQGREDLRAWLGNRSVDLHESSFGGGASISGWISGASGTESVSISVSHSGSGDQASTWYSGHIGRAAVSLHESASSGNGWISGTVGDRSVNVNRTASGSGIDYSGFVNGAGSGGGFVSVHAAFNGPIAQCDTLVPLLAVTA